MPECRFSNRRQTACVIKKIPVRFTSSDFRHNSEGYAVKPASYDRRLSTLGSIATALTRMPTGPRDSAHSTEASTCSAFVKSQIRVLYAESNFFLTCWAYASDSSNFTSNTVTCAPASNNEPANVGPSNPPPPAIMACRPSRRNRSSDVIANRYHFIRCEGIADCINNG